MSVKSEINRLSNNITEALAAVAEQGVEIPTGAGSDELPDLIRQIATKIYIQADEPQNVASGTVWIDT